MTKVPAADKPDVPAWLHWPLRVFAVLVVLPFRLAWEAVRLIGRALHRAVLTPLAWARRCLVVTPIAWTWRRGNRSPTPYGRRSP